MAETTPTATPAPAADVSMDAIVAEALAEVEASGGSVLPPDGVETDAKVDIDAETQAAIDKTLGLDAETAPAEGEAPAAVAPVAEVVPDDLATVRARKMLAAATEKEKAAREHVEGFEGKLRGDLKVSPRAALAKLGLTLDELIDASLAEVNPPAEPVPEDRVTALEKRIAARDAAETQAKIDAEITAIQARVTADQRFAHVHKAMKADPNIVSDFMVEYFNAHKSPITWDKAAALINADLRALTGAAEPPAAAPTASQVAARAPSKVTAAAPQRPDPQTLTNTPARATTPAQEDDPTIHMSPDKAIAWLVEHAS